MGGWKSKGLVRDGATFVNVQVWRCGPSGCLTGAQTTQEAAETRL